MVNYTVRLSKKAEKYLDGLSDHLAEPLLQAIIKLEKNPRPDGCKKLTNREGFRIRVGQYRIIYDIFDSELIIEIITVGHRKDIYK